MLESNAPPRSDNSEKTPDPPIETHEDSDVKQPPETSKRQRSARGTVSKMFNGNIQTICETWNLENVMQCASN